MTEIPEDVMCIATALVSGQSGFLDGRTGREIVARAIMSERRRCAKVAEQMAYGNARSVRQHLDDHSLDFQRFRDGCKAVAKAIMAERERCAQVAKAEYDLMESAGLSHPEDSLSRDNCFARARSASAIERGIRQGKAALEDTETKE